MNDDAVAALLRELIGLWGPLDVPKKQQGMAVVGKFYDELHSQLMQKITSVLNAEYDARAKLWESVVIGLTELVGYDAGKDAGKLVEQVHEIAELKLRLQESLRRNVELLEANKSFMGSMEAMSPSEGVQELKTWLIELKQKFARYDEMEDKVSVLLISLDQMNPLPVFFGSEGIHAQQAIQSLRAMFPSNYFKQQPGEEA